MKYLIAILAVGALMLAAASDSYAQKGYGYGGYGHGRGLLDRLGRGGNGYGQGQWGHWNHHRHWGYQHHPGNVPVLPPPAYMSGPPTAAVTYPYYTTRGPRDFLLANPPSIGP